LNSSLASEKKRQIEALKEKMKLRKANRMKNLDEKQQVTKVDFSAMPK